MRWQAGLVAALVMLAAPALAQQDSDLPVELTAEEMTYERDLGIVTARGKVEVVQGERILTADTISYNQRDDVVTASGNVALLEPTGDVLFADHVQLSDNFKQGVVRELKARLSNNARLSARSARREGENRTVLENAVFTRCEACPGREDEPPIWQIKAGSVTRDLDNEIVEYDDAVIEAFGVPVFYAPYFFHPDPTVERKSGLLAPIFGRSGELGVEYTQPIYLVLDDQSDMTLSPRITSKEGLVMEGEYRQRFNAGLWETEGSITFVDEIDSLNVKTGDEVFRGHFRSRGDFALAEQFRWGFDLFRASDDTYLRRYNIFSGSTLRSTAFLTGFNRRHAVSVEAFSFQGLRNNDKAGDTPIILPLTSFTAGGEPEALGGRLDTTFSAVGLQRTGGRDVRRLSADGGWQRQFIDETGGMTTTGLFLRADGYMISEAQSTDVTAVNDDSFEGRIWPMAMLDWRMPMVSRHGTMYQTLEPRVQLLASPGGGNPDAIPNEDSLSFEFTDANLFSRNRFTGHDRVESGSRINYGVKTGLHGDGGGMSEIEVGQSIRLNGNSAFGGGTGLDDRLSDVVGRLTIAPTEQINYTMRLRVDIDGIKLDRHEHRLSYRDETLKLEVGYLSLPRTGNGVAAGNTEEISFDGTVKFAEHWQLLGGYRGDFAGGGIIRIESGLQYIDECFDFQIGAVRDFTSEGDNEASTSVFVRFRLKGLN